LGKMGVSGLEMTEPLPWPLGVVRPPTKIKIGVTEITPKSHLDRSVWGWSNHFRGPLMQEKIDFRVDLFYTCVL
jgi:hypothetical protein